MAESFREVRDILFRRAGGAHSLAEAAVNMGISQGDLHRQMMAGDVLAMTLGDAIVVPKVQFDDRMAVLAGIGEVTRAFRGASAGSWSTLQFLTDRDPNLSGTTPIAALRDGHVDAVVAAARAYLRADED